MIKNIHESEKDFLDKYDASAFKGPITSVDTVIFTVFDNHLHVLTVKRAEHPFKDQWSLIGGFINIDEDVDIEATAKRKLKEKTGVRTPYLEQFGTIGNKKRDPRGWSVTTVYFALIPCDNIQLEAGKGEYDLNNAEGANGISDGKIDLSDAIFSQLRIWQDLNQNGISEASELKSLSDLSITSINVSPNSLTPSNQINNGNLVISEGSYLKSDGTTGTYANLDLAVNQSNSSSYAYTDSEGNVIGDYNLNLEVLSLPMIRGYGDVKALPIAASQDESLLNSLL